MRYESLIATVTSFECNNIIGPSSFELAAESINLRIPCLYLRKQNPIIKTFPRLFSVICVWVSVEVLHPVGIEDHLQGENIQSYKRKPTTGTRCPTLFEKWHGMFYMSSHTDTGHTKVFDYPVTQTQDIPRSLITQSHRHRTYQGLWLPSHTDTGHTKVFDYPRQTSH